MLRLCGMCLNQQTTGVLKLRHGQPGGPMSVAHNMPHPHYAQNVRCNDTSKDNTMKVVKIINHYKKIRKTAITTGLGGSKYKLSI